MTELDDIDEILTKSHKFYDKGISLMNEGNKLIHDGIYKFSNDISLRLALAAQMASTSSFHDAIELYRTILQISSNDPYALTGLGIIYFELEKFDKSFKLAQTSLSIRDMPETRILLCRHYLSQGNLIEVKKILSEILRKDPTNPDANLLKQRVEHISAGDDQPNNFR